MENPQTDHCQMVKVLTTAQHVTAESPMEILISLIQILVNFIIFEDEF